MNLTEVRKLKPALAGLDDQSLVNALQNLYYPKASIEEVANTFGYKPTPKEKGLGQVVKEGFLSGVEQQGAGLSIMRGADAQTIASDVADANQYTPDAAQKAFAESLQQKAQEFNEADGFWNSVVAGAKIAGNAITNPKQSAGVIAQSLGSSVPAFAGAAAGSFVPVAGQVAGYIGGNMLSNIQGEAAQKLTADLQAAGVDVSNPAKVKSFLEQNPELIENARSYAPKKGGAVGLIEGAVDAATLGAAKALKPIYKSTGLLGKAGIVAGGMGAQGASEAAGAYFSPLAVDEAQNAGEALTEGVFGGLAGLSDIAIIANAARKEKAQGMQKLTTATDVDSAIAGFEQSVTPATQVTAIQQPLVEGTNAQGLLASQMTGVDPMQAAMQPALQPQSVDNIIQEAQAATPSAQPIETAQQPTSVAPSAIETLQPQLSSPEAPQNEFRNLGQEAFTNGIPRVPPESLPKADKQAWLGGWDAANIASPTPFTPAKTEKEVALSKTLKAKKQAKLNEMLSPEQIADLETKPAPPAVEQLDVEIQDVAPLDVRYGKDHRPLHKGGKPFKTKNAAKVAKEQQPMMRVVPVKGGFALAEKTPAQIAAHEAAGRRLGRTQIGQAGMPYAAHEFLAAQGGLSPNTRADLGIDGNPRIGNRRLFAAAGRGLSIEEATARLLEEGYINTDDHNAAYNVIQRSIRGEPQYTPEGFERIAQMEANAQYEEYEQAHQDEAQNNPDYDPFADSSLSEDFTLDDAEESFTRASTEQKAKIAALSDKLSAIGYDVSEITDELLATSTTTNERDFYAELEQHFERLAETGSNTSRGEVNSGSAQKAGQQGDTARQGDADSLREDGGGQSQAPIATEPTRWKILEKSTNTILAETDDKRRVRALDKSKFEAIPVYENAAPKLELKGKTQEEERQAIKDAEAAEKSAAKEEARLAEAEKKARDDSEIKLRAEAAAGRFELGGNAMDELSGQTDLLSAPQQEQSNAPAETQTEQLPAGWVKRGDFYEYQSNNESSVTPEQIANELGITLTRREGSPMVGIPSHKWESSKKTLEDKGLIESNKGAENATQPEQKSADRLRAEADLQAALADLGDILITASGARSIVPQDNQKLFPVLVKLFDAAFRLGYHKFKDAAKFALDQIREKIGKEAADSLTLDHLSGAYIAMSSGKPEADNIRTVSKIDSKEEIENHVAKAHNEVKDSSNVPNTNASNEPNSAGVQPQSAVGDAVQDEQGAVASGDRGAGGQATGSEGRGEQSDSGVQAGSTVAGGERSDQLLRGEIGTGQSESGDARTDFGERSGDSGITGVPPETIPAKTVGESATTGTDELKQKVAQKDAPTNVEVANLENVRETLPALLKNQQEDVHTAEVRFAKPDGYGMLFTNGTGTGKTFVGLGVVKRFALQGKTNTLIVVPDAKIAEDWAQSGKLLGLNILPLPSTADAGHGIVVTTYANLRANDSLARRNWNLVIADEAHKLMGSAPAEITGALENLRAITNHPDGVYTRFEMLNRSLVEKINEVGALIKSLHKDGKKDLAAKAEDELKALSIKSHEAMTKARNDVDAAQGASRTRAVFLSATPFAYEKNIEWAQGYLFEYPATPESLSYNQPNGYQQYMIENFGYRMKFNKLTEPDAKVNRGLMQRQFNTRLKKEGVLSGRMLDVVPDYDRRFVLVDSAIGNKIDEAMDWLKDETAKTDSNNKSKPKDEQTNGMALLRDYIAGNFKYLERRYLLEAIKAKEAIDIVKSHMALGRKVVVFHDYKKGDSKNPFDIHTNQIQFSDDTSHKKLAAINQAITAFRAKFPELVNGLNDIDAPIELFKKKIPETLLVNGNEKRADLLKRYKLFQDDSTGPLVMLVQSDKNAGWSGHDTTGVNQRVLINLGQPTAPTLAIQQEGRIYRTGQFSNAIMRYLNTGTNWEKWAFATTIASRASTAENLGVGESARALKDAFINAFEESDKYPAGHEGEGTGGKERDKAANNALSEFDRAKSYYFSQLKKTSKTKAQEGADYFATPEPLGMKMAQWLDTHAGDKTLEPSAGHGAISRFLSDESKRTVIEPSTTLRSRLALVMNPADDRILDGDFESLDITNKYDGIVMNPPFGVGGKTAIEHVAKAATHLRNGGRIVALIPSGGMADKRLDQWLYGETERPVKPLMTHPVYGDIYRGDTVTSRAGFIPNSDTGITVDSISNGTLMTKVKREHSTYTTALTNESITSVKPTGARTEKVKLAEDLHLIADIKLPSSTFERAGTSVATHVIVLQKGDTNIQQRNIDLTNSEDINDLFDNIENVDFAKREQVEQEAPKLDTRSAVLPIAQQAAQTGDMVKLGDKEYPVEIYKTNAGKDIRGAWVESRQKALSFGRSTFQKSGKGFFVRERDFPKDDTAFSRGGNSDAAFAAEVLNELAQQDEAFRYPISKSQTLEGNIKAAMPDAEYLGDATREDEKSESGANTRQLFRTPHGKDFYIYERGKEVWIDVSRLEEGERGSAIYHAVANYAHNTGKKFVGNPAGLSEAAIARRTQAMLSSALRFGSIDHFEPAPEQLKGVASKGIPALEWRGSDYDKLQSLIESAVASLENQYPAIGNYRYDFNTNKFFDRDGNEVTRSRFVAGSKSAGVRASRTGEAGLRKGILLASLMASESSERPAILERFFRGSAQLASSDSLKALFSRGIWRSALADGVESINAKAQPEEGWRLNILGLVNKGKVKADEVEWSGINEWLKLQQGKVTKEQVMSYLNGNGVRVEEVTLGKPITELPDGWEAGQDKYGNWVVRNDKGVPVTTPQRTREQAIEGMPRVEKPTKYSQYQQAGGENYREVLLTLPKQSIKDPYLNLVDEIDELLEKKNRGSITDLEQESLYEKLRLQNNEFRDKRPTNLKKKLYEARGNLTNYKSSHWDAPNVLAHIRLNDRVSSVTGYVIRNKKSGNEGVVFYDRAEAQKALDQMPPSLRPNLLIAEKEVNQRVLFVEEVQSDWGQEGKKKGFQKDASVIGSIKKVGDHPSGVGGKYLVLDKDGNTIKPSASAEHWGGTSEQDVKEKVVKSFAASTPNAPFVTHTDKWLTLALKRIVKLAVDEGYDKVAFINGEQSADRYDLSKQIDKVEWAKYDDDRVDVWFEKSDGGRREKAGRFKLEELDGIVGKELGQKIVNSFNTGEKNGEYQGVDLKVGGEGMKAFYDKIVPAAANTLLKKLGGEKMESVSFGNSDLTYDEIQKKLEDFDKYPAGSQERAALRKQQESAQDDRSTLVGAQQGFIITDKMREHASDGLPMFKKQASTGMPIEAVQALVDKLSSKIDVTVVATPEDLPVPAPSDAKGLYHNGKAWIVASNNANAREVAETYAHEVIGHYGLRAMLGKEVHKKTMGLIQLAIKSGNKPLNAIRDQIRKTYIDENGKFNLTPNQEADEIAAAVAQTAIDEDGNLKAGFGFMKAVYAKIAQFLRDMGIDIKFTNAELQGLLTASLKQLGVGEKMDGGNVTVLSRKPFNGSEIAKTPLDPAQTTIMVDGVERPAQNSNGKSIHWSEEGARNFWRWFGDSKVVDAEGRPLVVYHGAENAGFSIFKTNRKSRVDDAYFFTSNRRMARTYSGTNNDIDLIEDEDGNVYSEKSSGIYPTYLKIDYPYESYFNGANWDGAIDEDKAPYQLMDEDGDIYDTVYTLEDAEEAIDSGEAISYEKETNLGMTTNTEVALAKRLDNDGAILFDVMDNGGNFEDYEDGDVYVVFKPEQIKSATGNNGNFDPTNPDIRYSRGEDLLSTYTEEEARAKQEREERLLKEENKAPTKPVKKVTADQVDLFNPQGGLFSRSPLTTSLNNAYGSIDGLKERTTALANDLFSSVGTVSWWDKTVGTMQNLAKRSPAFNRVYEATQNFLGDVSTFATNASKLAPSLLPTLEKFSDLVKPLPEAKAKEATARAVWEGTLLWARDDNGRLVTIEEKEAKAEKLDVHDKASALLKADAVAPNVMKMWQGLPIDQYESIIEGKYKSTFLQAGTVFTDKELREKFSMDDAQIALYREFRAATDKSLTDLALSEMQRLAGKDGTSIEGLGLEKASEVLRDHLMAQSNEKNDLLGVANKIIDIANNTNRLIQNGYAPLMRFGHYTLDVTVNEEREYFGLFESKFEANKMARIMQRNYPDGVVTQGTMNDQAYKEFEGISPETAEIYGKILGLDSQGTSEADKAHREFIKASTSNRSALRRLLHRKGIAGFNEDIGRVLAGFIYSNARRSSSNINTGEIKDAIQDIPKSEGELGAMATKLREYVQNPQEEAQALRGLLFAQYLGGSIASAMVNLTQPFSMTFPFLAQYGGVRKSAARMVEAAKLAVSDKVSKELEKAIERAKADGHITPQEVHTLMSQAQGRMSLTSGDGTKVGDATAMMNNGLVKTMFAWGRLFAMAEVSNRKVTFIAAYNTAIEEGINNPYQFAVNAINETQGVYNKANKPQWARGAIGSTLFTFKQFSINYVELFYRLAFAGKEGSLERKNGRKAAILMAATLFLMAGAGGLPFADDIDDLVDGIMESIGYSFSSKQAKHKFFAMFLGQDGAKFIEKGVSGIAGVPIDLNRLGMGNLIPATGLFIKKQDHGNDVAELFGAAGDLAKRAYAGAEKTIKLDISGAAAEFSPKAISSALKGIDMAKNDMYRDSRGNKVIETDTTDAVFKAIGFQPNDVAQAQEANRYKQKIKDQLTSKEAEIADKIAQAVFERDTEKRQEANDQLRKWNEDNPDLPIRIKQEQILRRVLAMRQTREQRIMKSSPKEIRAALRSEM